jgi:hypothetical protein
MTKTCGGDGEGSGAALVVGAALAVGAALPVGEGEVVVADSACGVALPDDETIGPQATATDRKSVSAHRIIAISLERGWSALP